MIASTDKTCQGEYCGGKIANGQHCAREKEAREPNRIKAVIETLDSCGGNAGWRWLEPLLKALLLLLSDQVELRQWADNQTGNPRYFNGINQMPNPNV